MVKLNVPGGIGGVTRITITGAADILLSDLNLHGCYTPGIINLCNIETNS